MSIFNLPDNKLELIKRLNDILRDASDKDVEAIGGALEFYAVKPIGDDRLGDDYVKIQKVGQNKQVEQDEDGQDEDEPANMESTYCKWCDIKVEIDPYDFHHLFCKPRAKYHMCENCNEHVVLDGDKCKFCMKFLKEKLREEFGASDEDDEDEDEDDYEDDEDDDEDEDDEDEETFQKQQAEQSKQSQQAELKATIPVNEMSSSKHSNVASPRQTKISVCSDCGLVGSFPDKNCADCACAQFDSSLERKQTEPTKPAELQITTKSEIKQKEEPTILTDNGQSFNDLINQSLKASRAINHIENTVRLALVNAANDITKHPIFVKIQLDHAYTNEMISWVLENMFAPTDYSYIRLSVEGHQCQFRIFGRQ